MLLSQPCAAESARDCAFEVMLPSFALTYPTIANSMVNNPMLCDLRDPGRSCGADLGFGTCTPFELVCREKNWTASAACDSCFWMKLFIELGKLVRPRDSTPPRRAELSSWAPGPPFNGPLALMHRRRGGA